jgi:fucose permease
VLAPDAPLAAPALFLFGATVGGMDVAMNANAVEVERRLRRAVMSSSHGFWSLGGFAGGGLGGLLIKDGGALPHAIIVTVLAIIVFFFATRGLVTETKPTIRQRFRFSPPKNPAVYLIGIMALFSMIPEGAVLDWAALYLKQELGAGIATAGFAFAAFSGTMALMRFAGDAVRNRFGAVATLRVSALIAATGMLVGGFAPSAWVAVLAFAFSGFGIANMVPIAFSAAGNQPGLSPGVGLSTVTVMGYSGILLAPSIIGFIGQHVGFSPAFIGVSVLLIVVFLMAGLARAADMPATSV